MIYEIYALWFLRLLSLDHAHAMRSRPWFRGQHIVCRRIGNPIFLYQRRAHRICSTVPLFCFTRNAFRIFLLKILHPRKSVRSCEIVILLKTRAAWTFFSEDRDHNSKAFYSMRKQHSTKGSTLQSNRYLQQLRDPRNEGSLRLLQIRERGSAKGYHQWARGVGWAENKEYRCHWYFIFVYSYILVLQARSRLYRRRSLQVNSK